MDTVTEAQQAFKGALEALATSADLDEAQAESLVHDACAAVNILAESMKKTTRPEFSTGAWQIEALAIARGVYTSWESVARACSGAKVAQRLDSVAPNLCARWLDGLKSLGSCAAVAKEMMKNEGMQEPKVDFDSAEVVSEGFLSAAWPELKDRGGLRSSRWRARVSAAQFLLSLAEHDLSECDERAAALLEVLLQAVVFGTALVDSQWQVRQAVVPAVTRLLTASRNVLAQSSWANLTWGILAICVDPQPEVQVTATDAVLQHLLLPPSLQSKVVVQGLLDRFVTVTIGVTESLDSAYNSLEEINTLQSAVHAAVLLELLPHQTAFEVHEHGIVNVDRIPILVVAASFSLAASEKKGDKFYSASLMKLLRSLGSYLTSLLAMLNPAMPLYECDKLARYCKRRGVLDDVTGMKLGTVPYATSLRGLAIALKASESNMKNFAAVSNDNSIGSMQLDALQHVSEMLHIPSQLTRCYKEGNTDGEVESYLLCGKLYMNMALVLVKNPVWTAQQAWKNEEIMYNIFLSFAALASGIIESERTWVDEMGLCKLSNDILVYFSIALQAESCLFPDEAVSPPGGNCSKVSSLETLVLRLLPKILSSLKDILKAGTRSVNLNNMSTVPKVDDLPVAIISAHQLRWCLGQVHHPNFKLHSEMVIRTALTALDHYSPSIKREGMKAFIHLATNISATELRWFKDAILDAVTRSLIGCEDLWPLAVEMAVALVTQIEGGNIRGYWYGAIMKEMLEDLDRHRSDEARLVVWLQLVTPQFESMGIVLVAHFKRLLPLLYYWLHAQAETTQLLVLANLRIIIKSTWPRIPFHASRIQEELMRAKKDSQERKSDLKVLAAIDEVERLCMLPAFLKVELPHRDQFCSDRMKLNLGQVALIIRLMQGSSFFWSAIYTPAHFCFRKTLYPFIWRQSFWLCLFPVFDYRISGIVNEPNSHHFYSLKTDGSGSSRTSVWHACRLPRCTFGFPILLHVTNPLHICAFKLIGQ